MKKLFFRYGFICFSFLIGCAHWYFRGKGAQLNMGYIDPNVYSGLAFNYRDIVAEAGPTYYASRIMHILPLSLACDLFGAWGTFVYLAFASGVATVLLVLILKRSMPAIGNFVSLFTALLLITVPSFTYEVSHSYVQISSNLYLLAAVLFSLRAGYNSKEIVLSGFFSVLVLNTQIKNLPLIASLLLALLFVANRNGFTIITILKKWLIGVVAGSVLIEVLFQLLQPRPTFRLSWWEQINTVFLIGRGNSEHDGLWSQFKRGEFPWHILTSLVCVILIIACWKKILRLEKESQYSGIKVLAFFGVIGTVAMFALQEGMHYPITTTFWYFDTFWIVTVCSFIPVFYFYLSRQFRGFKATFLFFAILPIATYLPNWIAYPGASTWLGTYRHQDYIHLGFWTVLVAFICAIIIDRKKIRITALLCLSMSLYLSTFEMPHLGTALRWNRVGDFTEVHNLFMDQEWLVKTWSDMEMHDGKSSVAVWSQDDDSRGYLGSMSSALGFIETRLTLGAFGPDSVSNWRLWKGRMDGILYFYMKDRGDFNSTVTSLAEQGCVTSQILLSPSKEVVMRKMICT
jgi:hypothetical protein